MRTQALTKQMYTANLDSDRDFHFRVKDPGSAATHFIGFLAAVLLTPVLLVHASDCGADLMTMIGMSVFMLSMILLYGASTSYHSFDISEKANLRLKRMDHMMIFILIAGTYTPVCLLTLPKPSGLMLLAAVWGIALVGIFIKGFWITCPKWFSSVLYIAMGWSCLSVLGQLFSLLPLHAFLWLLAGGLIYTAGGIIYALRLPLFDARHPMFGLHEIFHLFVMAGSLCHFVFMFCYLA